MSETEGAATSGLPGIQRVYSLSASPKHQSKRYPSNLAKSQYTAATFLIHQNEKKNDSVDLQIFLPFPFWSVTEEGVLHLLNTSSKTIRKFPCIFLINRNTYHIFQIFEVLVSWAFSWQYNPSMAHGFIMVYLLLEAELGSMTQTSWLGQEGVPHEHWTSTVVLVNIQAGSNLRISLFHPLLK